MCVHVYVSYWFFFFQHKGIISHAFVESVETFRLSDSVQTIGQNTLYFFFFAINIESILGIILYQHMEKETKDSSYNHYCILYLCHHLP